VTALAAALLVGPCLLPAVAVLGPRPAALPLAGALTAVAASVAGIASLLTGLSPAGWLVLVAVVINAAATAALKRRRPGRPPAGQMLQESLLIILAAAPALQLRRLPVDWDARSIWLFHSRWFYAGGRFLQGALGNPAFVFSHADYPPLVPATVGTFWRLTGRIDLALGQELIAVLNICVLALLAVAFTRLVRDRAGSALPAVAGALAMVGALGIGGIYFANGYADLLWATAAAAAVLYLLIAHPETTNTALGLVTVSIAGLTKNEGLAAAMVVLALAAVRHRRSRSALGGLGGCGVLMLAWPVLARAHGASPDLVPGRILGGPAIGPRLVMISQAARPFVFPVLIPALICAVVGWALFRQVRSDGGLAGPVWAWAAIGGAVASLMGAYLASPYDLRWHLRTSIDRTTIGPRILLLCDVLVWIVVLGAWWADGRSESGEDSPAHTVGGAPQRPPKSPPRLPPRSM
jgi:hypothetical protein